jgi:hypothetical protein
LIVSKEKTTSKCRRKAHTHSYIFQRDRKDREAYDRQKILYERFRDGCCRLHSRGRPRQFPENNHPVENEVAAILCHRSLHRMLMACW